MDFSSRKWEHWVHLERTEPLLIHPDKLEFLSITVSHLDNGTAYTSYPTPLSHPTLSSLAALTHLECVGFLFDTYPFKDLPALIDVSLCLHCVETDRWRIRTYSQGGVREVMASLAEHKLVSFSISAGDLDLASICELIKQWPGLRRLNLWPDDMGYLYTTHVTDSTRITEVVSLLHVRVLAVHHPTNFQNSGWSSETNYLSNSLSNLSLNLIPVRPSKGAGSRVPRGAKLLGSRRYRYTVYDIDVILASDAYAEKCPSLKLVGWMVPIPDTIHCKRVWCRREDNGGRRWWKCIVGEDCWPETDMDVVFS